MYADCAAKKTERLTGDGATPSFQPLEELLL